MVTMLTLLCLTFHVTLLLAEVRAQGTCTKVTACSCDYGGDVGVVDLSPLEGDASFKDKLDSGGVNMFSWNPCQPFTEGNCNNVAVCQIAGSDYYECGTQDSAEFVSDPTTGDLFLQYTSTDGTGFTRKSVMTLKCAQGDTQYTVAGESATQPGVYTFTLSSPHCCPNKGPAPPATTPGPGPSGGGGGDDGLSIGWWLSIGVFVLIFVYMSGGVAVTVGVQKKSGMEVIPNFALWGAFFSLVKDGVVFVVCCRWRAGASQYRNI